MTNEEALKIIESLVSRVTNKDVTLSLTQDLRHDQILDSLDTLVFFMELEQETGVSVPEIDSLVEDGWYSVEKLCSELLRV